MTYREFLNKVKTVEDEELRMYAEEALVKLDAEAEKRKGKRSEKEEAKRAENEALARHIAETILSTEPMTATDVAEALNTDRAEEDFVKVQKASYLCRLARDMGLVNETTVKIPKKGQQKAYQIVEV